MTLSEAKQKIIDFVNKYRGKTVLFNSLNESEKEAYSLTKIYRFHSYIVTNGEALRRAIDNTECHKKNNYNCFSDLTECMTISRI